jgi:predicted nucleotidyltransferase
MGITLPSAGIADALFSTVQQRVLALIFADPERDHSTLEVIRAVQSGRGAVQRELARLEQSGLVIAAEVGNQRRYRANRASPIFDELRGIVLKTVGLTEPLRTALRPLSDKIDVAFVFGSVAKGTDSARSDIDLLLIADEINYSDVYGVAQDVERVLDRQVNPTIMSRLDWKERIKEGNAFVLRVLAQPKVFVLGSDDELKGI